MLPFIDSNKTKPTNVRTFHVQFLFEVSFESSSIHCAANSNIFTMQVQFWSVAYLKRNQEMMRVLFKKKKHTQTKRNKNLLCLWKKTADKQINEESLFLNVSKKTYGSYVFVVARWKIVIKYNGIAEYRC